jgi:hypothetical protein
MPRHILIRFDWPPGDENGYIHEMRNFGEDIWRTLDLDKWAEISIEEVDRASDLLTVTVFSPRHVHRVATIIDKRLRKYRLADYATVSVSRA